MSPRIYLGNLPYRATEDELRQELARFGRVREVKIITDGGRSKGFGFAEFETSEEAAEAISAMDGQAFQGRNLKVNEAKERVRRA